MGMLSRQPWPALVFAAFTVAAAAACWRWSRDWDTWRASDWATDQGTLSAEEYQPDEAYESQKRYLTWSYEVRAQVTRALIRGDLTLWEAAACFRQANAPRPPRLRSCSDLHRGEAEEERLCRHVIQYVRVALEEEMQEGGLVVQLEAELEERSRQGDLRLPAPPSSVVGRLGLNVR